MARRVRAVSDGEQRYVGYKGKRYVNNEEFTWPSSGPLPLVKRNADGVIVSGWVELVSGEDDGIIEAPKKGKLDPKRKGLTPAMQIANATTTMPEASGASRPSDRIVG